LILKTTNGGLNWFFSNFPSGYNNLYSIIFTDSNTGIAVGDGGRILKTTNGGSNWISETSGTNNILLSTFFSDSNNGYAVGQDGFIIKTKDGGTTWVQQSSGTNYWLNSIYFIGNNGFTVGDNGTIIKLTQPDSYLWTPSTGLSATNIANPLANPVNTVNYTVTATTNGCIALDSLIVHVISITANAGTDKTITCGSIAQLDNVITNYPGNDTLQYHWSPATGLNNDTISNPTATIINNITYTVSVTSESGCIAIDSITVFVDPLTADVGTDKTITCGSIAQIDNVTTNYSEMVPYNITGHRLLV